MKILIDISDEGYDWIKNGFPDNEDEEFLIKAVKNGIVITSTEKAKVGELIDAYTKGFDAGVEIAKNKYERPKGAWSDLSQEGFHIGWIACTVCGSEPPRCTNYRSNFCPNCGADMRGEENG